MADGESGLTKGVGQDVATFRQLYPADPAKAAQMLLRRYSSSDLEPYFPRDLLERCAASVESVRETRARKGVSDREVSQPIAAARIMERLPARRVRETEVPGASSESTSVVPRGKVDGIDELGFMYVPLIQCTFPHSNPDPLHTYTRRNGRLEVTIAASVPTAGLPYGVPARLLAIYTTGEVKRTQCPDINLEKNLTEFLRKLRVPASSGRRGTIGVYQDQLNRMLNSVFTVVEDVEDGKTGRLGIDVDKCLFAQKYRLWKGSLEGGFFRLSKPLFDSILERSAPLSMDSIYKLRRSPFDLDLYAWLVYRLYTLNRVLDLPWGELALQFGQTYTRERDFQFYFNASLKRVLKEYPAARVEEIKGGIRLRPSRAAIRSVSTTVAA